MYARALAEFLESDYHHAWVLDDDMVPETTCLERLWAMAKKDPEAAFVFPVSQQMDGSIGVWPSWCAFVISRQIIDAVGLPMEELFWWAEDTEYLQWRILKPGIRGRWWERRWSITKRFDKEAGFLFGSTTTSRATCCMSICMSSVASVGIRGTW